LREFTGSQAGDDAAVASRSRLPHADDMDSLLTTLKPKRRWMQISLRTLLVLFTALCVVLSLWVVPAERQRRAVETIRALGGNISYGKVPSETFLGRWRQAYLEEVKIVDLDATPVTDAGLAHLLRGLTSLEGLVLTNTGVTDAGLAHVQGLTGLRVLGLYKTQVTDAGLRHVQGLTGLQTLRLDFTHVTDAGLHDLHGLTGLEMLTLNNTQVTDAGLAHLQGLTRLQDLQLKNTQVTDAGLVHLQGLRSLRQLYLGGTQVTNAGVTRLRQALPNCQIAGP